MLQKNIKNKQKTQIKKEWVPQKERVGHPWATPTLILGAQSTPIEHPPNTHSTPNPLTLGIFLKGLLIKGID
jgi:hypothetical protein